MITTAPGDTRFIASSTIDDEPCETGPEAGALLDRVRDLASLGSGLARFTEILDCGTEASDVLNEGALLPEARARFQSVFSGDGVPGLEPVILQGVKP